MMWYFNRWITFAASCLLQASAGLNYSFSIFAPAIKDTFKLTETQVSTVAACINFGGYLAIVSGTVYDALGHRPHFGPRLTIWIGAALLCAGYLGIYCGASGWLTLSLPQVLLLGFLAGNAGPWLDTGALVTNVRNFPDDRGTVVGILKSFLGLSATVYSTVYVSLFKPDATKFLLFLAVVPPLLCMVCSIGINYVPIECQEPDKGMPWTPSPYATPAASPFASPRYSLGMKSRHREVCVSKHTRFMLVYALVAIIAIYGMVSAIYTSHHHLNLEGRELLMGALLALLAALLLVPVSAGACIRHPRRRRRRCSGSYAGSISSGLAGPAPAPAGDSSSSAASPLLPPTGPEGHSSAPAGFRAQEGDSGSNGNECETTAVLDHTPWQALHTLVFWLIFLSYLVGVGSGLVFLNNLAGIVIALGGHKDGQVVLVSLFSVANASGRLLFGYVSEHFLHHQRTPRTAFLVLLSLLMLLLVMLLSGAVAADLSALALLGGFAFGGHWSVIPAVISDLFGLQHFASNYAAFQFAPAAGSYLLATLLTGIEYDRAAAAHKDGHYCLGQDCYSTTWRILIGCNVLSVVCTLWLMQVTRATYKALLQYEDEEQQTDEHQDDATANSHSQPGPLTRVSVS